MNHRREHLALCLSAVGLVAIAVGCSNHVTETVADTADASVSDGASSELSEDAPGAPARPDFEWAPDTPGPYRAGHRLLKVSYLPTGQTAEVQRELDLHVYYPTEDTDGTSPTYLGLFQLDFSYDNATLAPPVVAGNYPLHVYSHGHQGFAGASARNLAHLASHGWVVAAPDHTGNTTIDGSKRSNAIYFLRGQDISAVLDHLETLPSDDPLSGLIDPTETVLSGHSFGGYTAFTLAGGTWDLDALKAACDEGAGYGGDPCTEQELAAFEAGVEDSRIRGIIPMAAGDGDKFGPEGLRGIRIPILMLTGNEDLSATTRLSTAIWNKLPAGSAWVDIQGGCHQTFAVGGCANLQDDVGWTIVDTYLLAASRLWLLNDSSMAPLVDGSEKLAPQVSFQSR